ncbi:MAG: STY0301 family protein [Massilia sp.]
MTNILKTLCLFPAFAVSAALSAADAVHFAPLATCPAEIAQESLPLAKAPANWTASNRGALILHAIDLSYGPPAEMAFLKPQIVPSRGHTTHYEWRELAAGGKVGDLWLACSYGRSDNVVLGKKLENKYAVCKSSDGKDPQGRPVISLSCAP